MSGRQPSHPLGWQQRSPSPWSPVAPSPPPIIGGARRSSLTYLNPQRPQMPGFDENRSSLTPLSAFHPPIPKAGPSPSNQRRAGFTNGPKPYRPFHDSGVSSSFQLSPTPSPVVWQSPTPPTFAPSNRPNLPRQPSPSPRYSVPTPSPRPYEYIVYDDDIKYGPTTAEIIANQSQDYIDEKLAEYQMTIMYLQGK